jgi:hypothetical protein
MLARAASKATNCCAPAAGSTSRQQKLQYAQILHYAPAEAQRV